MSFIKKNLVYFLWALTVVVLFAVSFRSYNSTTSILAQVEPQKYAISFHKAVRVKELYVISGQQVKKGDPLLKVERQDLLLEVDSKKNTLARLQAQKIIKEIEKKHQRESTQMSIDLKNSQINSEIKRLEMLLDQQKQISTSIQSMNVWQDSINSTDHSYIQLRIDVLQSEKSTLQQQYRLQLSKIDKIFAMETEELDNELHQVQEELNLLMQEERELYQTAKADGTIGNIRIEKDELAPAFSTLITIYDDNPTVIRALIHEQQVNELEIGMSVVIESTNRDYAVNGQILEIGSRIIEYPDRLKMRPELPVYGREIFVKIPNESDFLHGEKVYVKSQ